MSGAPLFVGRVSNPTLQGAPRPAGGRWAEGRAERLPEIAAEFVRLNVSLTLRDAALSIGTSWQ
jgi:hypothetical protein